MNHAAELYTQVQALLKTRFAAKLIFQRLGLVVTVRVLYFECKW